MAPEKITVTYFNGRGRAEAARWVLKAAGVEFEDRRVQGDEWMQLKPNTPTGQLPMLTVDGKDIAQSGAMVHYLADEFGLNGSSKFEAAEVHMVWDTLQDVVTAAVKAMFCKDEEEKKKLFEEYQTNALPKFIQFVERRLDGGKQWLVGEKMTAADIAVACFFNGLPDASALEASPSVSDLVKRVTDLPGIKEWIETRPETQF